jgi:hypothetical protein
LDPFLYLDRDTFVHRLDPRTKIFLLFGAFVLAFLFVNPLYGLAVLAVVLLFGQLARSLVNLKRIRFVLVMIAIMTVILWTLFGSGETPLFLFVEREALLYGVGIALRIDTTIIAGMIFLSTTRNEEIATGLVKLGIPYRFAFAVSTALRLVPTIAATGFDHRPGAALTRPRPGVRQHHPARPQERPAPRPRLRLHHPLDQRLLHGARIQRLRGEQETHLLPPASHDPQRRHRPGDTRPAARRRDSATRSGLRGSGRVQQMSISRSAFQLVSRQQEIGFARRGTLRQQVHANCCRRERFRKTLTEPRRKRKKPKC